ncbi:MAG: hypothetical protein IPJ65_29125 [Archangiaceae bacterium]|nr:hypothetical protein [Archangiaceae bacterium]
MGPASMVSSVLGGIDFIGFDKRGSSLIARVDNSSTFVSATGDFTQKSSWTFVNMGRADGDTLPLNSIDQLQGTASNEWRLINHRGFVYSATAAPSMTTVWTKIWSPLASPSVPADFAAQYAADPTLCRMDVSGGGVPSPSNPAYVAPDLSVIVTLSGGLNQDGDAAPGVCISTDQGLHFYNRPFLGVPTDVSSPGPIGVYCTDKDHCWAFNGLPFQKGTAYIYGSTNASAGKTSTWSAATVPTGFATAEDVELTGMFFAPDGTHGWVVGNKSRKPLMLRTTDSGKTWTDVSGSVSAAQSDLYGGFALDADHVWVVGRYGALLATSTAQQ